MLRPAEKIINGKRNAETPVKNSAKLLVARKLPFLVGGQKVVGGQTQQAVVLVSRTYKRPRFLRRKTAMFENADGQVIQLDMPERDEKPWMMEWIVTPASHGALVAINRRSLGLSCGGASSMNCICANVSGSRLKTR